MKRMLKVFLPGLFLTTLCTIAGEIGFNEDFSLAEDRTIPLQQLIPGTDDYFYYHCLDSQLRGKYERVHELLAQWGKQHHNTGLMQEIRNRQALLEYGEKPEEALQLIRQQLNLRFGHSKREPDKTPSYPTILDPERISWRRLRDKWLRHPDGIRYFERLGYERLIRDTLNADQRRRLLGLLQRADYPNLPKLVIADLNYKNSGGFGSHKVHGKMTLEQLDQCLELLPALRNNSQFIDIYLSKIRPSEDADPHSRPVRQEHLQRLWAFVSQLAPAHNSLKACVLYRQLEYDRQEGNYDRERFMEYIKLPRNMFYVNRDYLAKMEFRRARAELRKSYQDQTLLPPINTDEALVRDYLAHFLVDAPDYKAFTEYIEQQYLQELFAETKIINGIGDMQTWYNLLPAEKYRKLKERIDLTFLPQNKASIGRNEEVKLQVAIKNVEKLIVNIYELNTINYYRDQKKEITTAVDLDGLVPNFERVVEYESKPLRRHVESLSFPEIKEAGVFVVELIGNGRSSRALIRRGSLNLHQRSGAAGHVFRIYDETGTFLPNASIWMAGKSYPANEGGEILIPFTNEPTQQSIILQQGNFAVLRKFQHRMEEYSLQVGFHVPRESLIAGETARILVNPALTLNGVLLDRTLLLDPKLAVFSTDRDGITSSTKSREIKLADDEEWIYEIKVPDKLTNLKFTFSAEVEQLSQNKKIELADSYSLLLNGIESYERIADLFLRRSSEGYCLDFLGRSGEPIADRAVQLSFKHRMLKDTERIVLKTDANGRINLGKLKEITALSALVKDVTAQEWSLRDDGYSQPNVIQVKAGMPVVIPCTETKDESGFAPFSLLEIRDGQPVRDYAGHVTLKGGYLTAKDLPAGDYTLRIKSTSQTTPIRVADVLNPKRNDGILVGRARLLEATNPLPIQIVTLGTINDTLLIKLEGASPNARVHLLCQRFIPEFSLFDNVPELSPPVRSIGLPPVLSQYLSGRNIGDEYRYILERKYATKYPGNMLKRPSLLLAPWALQTTETGIDQAKRGEAWADEPQAAAKAMRRSRRGVLAGAGGAFGEAIIEGSAFSCYNFLPSTAVLLENLRPDKKGNITVPLAKLGAGAYVEVLVIDGSECAFRSVSLPEKEETYKDLRLRRGLPEGKALAERKKMTPLQQNQAFTIADMSTSKLELYDSLDKVFNLFSTLSGDKTLATFNFILHWPEMTDNEKREKYSKYACHELNFFLSHKDPKFCKAVVLPFISNKKNKTFMDRYLLGEDLSPFLHPWAYNRLNIVEKILLGDRLEGQKQATTRQVKEACDLIPPNVERFNRLFDTAVMGNAMEGGGFDAAGEFGGAFGGAPATEEAEVEEISWGSKEKLAKKSAARFKLAKLANGRARKSLEESDKEYAKRRVENKKQDAKDRQRVTQLFRKLETTKEWVENNYYHLPIEEQLADLITVNAFWNDYASREIGKPFLSGNVAEASSNFSEMLLALAVLDLPFKAGTHETKLDKRSLQVKPAGNAIAFHREIMPAIIAENSLPFLISQNFFDPVNRYRYENNEKIDRFIREEFIKGKVYGCQLVLTNPTSNRRKINVLQQIPLGAIPVKKTNYTKGHNRQLEPYSTQALEYYFYFPASGQFRHYPVHVAQNEVLVGAAKPFVFNVVDRPTIIDKESWEYISQNGSLEEVVEFLNTHNLGRIDLSLIAFRMKDKKAFDTVLPLLAKRLTYDDTLWSYSVFHNQPERIREYLPHTGLAKQCGMIFDSPLLTVAPIPRLLYQHKEYWPLVNARAYQLGERRKILNQQFFQQYEAFTKMLSYRDRLNSSDRLAVIVYLLLQDRVSEALGQFDKIKKTELETPMQYDYLDAYLSFYREKSEQGASIAKKYRDYPVKRWRDMFAAIAAQAEEITGAKTAVLDPEDRDQVQAKNADTAPSLEMSREGDRFLLVHRNLQMVRIHYYPMDVELLFSRNPFVKDISGGFSIIRPQKTIDLKLNAKKGETDFRVPKEFAARNVMIEVAGNGITRRQAYYPNSLVVQMIPTYGQIRVTRQGSGKRLPRIYVKVYARMKNKQINFFKDGYTDLRGRFDYASLSTDEISQVEKFSILILSDEFGAVVREADPPKM